MNGPTEHDPFDDAVLDAATSCADDDELVVTRAVLVYEVLRADGSRGWCAHRTDSCATWEAAGLLRAAARVYEDRS